MNIEYCLRRACRFTPQNIAVRHEDHELTYREFDLRVDITARRLAALTAKGERIAVLMGNSPAYLNLYFSMPRAGAMIVPLNTRWNAADIAFTLTDSNAAYLIVDERFAHQCDALRSLVPSLRGILYYGAGDCPPGLIDLRSSAQSDAVFDEPHEEDLVGLFYTSGTTGGPKGAMLTHRNLYMNALHTLLPPAFFDPDARYLHVAPMFHLADVGSILAVTLTGGSHSFLAAFDPEGTLRAIEKYRITSLVLVPTMINMVLNHPSFGQYDLSSLKRISYGATPMPLPLMQQAMEKLPCGFTQGYGMTELSPLATVLRPEDHKLDPGYRPIASAGKPCLGVEVRVVDFEDRELAPGQAGEVVVRGPNVMKGYWKRPEITAEVLRGGWMHTGDLGAFDEDGFLYILDRKKDMIKPGGENVYSPEVESVVCAHPAVLEAAVIGVPDPRWGEAIRAVVALRPGAHASEPELIEWCRHRLTHFKCPASVVFADALPKGGTGKIQKNLLRERYGSAGTFNAGANV